MWSNKLKVLGIIAIAVFLMTVPRLAIAQKRSEQEQRVFEAASERFQKNTHKVKLDSSGKIIPWTTPQSDAYNVFLFNRWNFIKTMVPNSPGPAPRSDYPQYYFYCAFRPKDGTLEVDTWMNDVGEKMPNWFESARLYYAYTGDESVMNLYHDFLDYSLAHGTSPADFDWPNFPYTTTNAGDTVYQGFTSTGRFKLHEVQVDHAADIGLTYFRMYKYYNDEKYLKAAIDVANTLADKVKVGTAEQSPWPYRVVMSTGEVMAPYGANWAGAYLLLRNLMEDNKGRVDAYRRACKLVQDFVLAFPMKTGYWTDGHTDADINSNTYKSNMSASNMKLLLFDYPDFTPDWKTDIQKLLKWTEDYFIFRGDSSEPAEMWGARIVGEQDRYIFKMDYQTARYAAECARWYALTGDEDYKEHAYRGLNWVTYCSDSSGMSFECPLSVGISNWWSDTYGECPRMFYHAFAGVPEWSPPGENHILYSREVLKNVKYKDKGLEYEATGEGGIDYLKLIAAPQKITLNGKSISKIKELNRTGYVIKKIPGNEYSIQLFRGAAGKVDITY